MINIQISTHSGCGKVVLVSFGLYLLYMTFFSREITKTPSESECTSSGERSIGNVSLLYDQIGNLGSFHRHVYTIIVELF